MFGPLSPEESAIIATLPRITRAREHRLYTRNGDRWIDCWADGGRALMGHRPKGLSIRIKNEIDRGLYAPYPGVWEERLKKTLLHMFPGYTSVRIFSNAERAISALNLGAPPVDPLDLSLPYTAGTPAFWGRPLLPDHPRSDYLFPVMPLPGLSDVQPVLLRNAGETEYPGDMVSPVILAALNRSCASVEERSESGITPISPGIADIWERRGPYMLFRGNDEKYRELFERLFSLKVLIAPSRNRGSIIPIGLSTKESVLLATGGFFRA